MTLYMKEGERVNRLIYTVPLAWDGKRTQEFLRIGCGLSWRMVVRLRNMDGGITVDGVVRRTIDPVRAGETVVLTLPQDTLRVEPTAMPIAVAFEDDMLLVVDKPPYLAVHPSAGRPEPTLANGVMAYWQERGENHSFRPVNRLDRNTSGLLLAAKNAHITYALTRKPHKEYLALVHGVLTGEGLIDQPLRLQEGSFIAREVGAGGKESRTHWQALASDGEITLVRLWLETGRTHQIRVHMAWLGHPLLGDTLYGCEDGLLPRHGLHCARMCFTHPLTGKEIDLKSPLPADMQAVLDARGIKEEI